MEDVTRRLAEVLAEHSEAREALTLLMRSPIFGRETVSRALGELSEHLVATLVGGRRVDRNNRGFDVVDGNNRSIEVKARQVSRYGETLQFNFGKHSLHATEVVCIAWDDSDKSTPPRILAAYRGSVHEFTRAWATPNQKSYSFRTNLGRLRRTVSIAAAADGLSDS